ncbi:GapR family DNA-binding domain-containing protein [Zymomonas mobilis]|uniref:GapR family DNA-binding domain-containing protein n=1 Tax=Zymomonas mobilis TaxID=542 RepID=UPI0039E8B639
MTTKRSEYVLKPTKECFDTISEITTSRDISQKLEPLIQLLIRLEGEKAQADEQITSTYKELKKQKFDVKKIRQVVASHRSGQPDRVIRPLVNQIITDKLGR